MQRSVVQIISTFSLCSKRLIRHKFWNYFIEIINNITWYQYLQYHILVELRRHVLLLKLCFLLQTSNENRNVMLIWFLQKYHQCIQQIQIVNLYDINKSAIRRVKLCNKYLLVDKFTLSCTIQKTFQTKSEYRCYDSLHSPLTCSHFGLEIRQQMKTIFPIREMTKQIIPITRAINSEFILGHSGQWRKKMYQLHH